MSKYKDFNDSSQNYDTIRIAVGFDIIAGMVPYYCKKSLKDLHILDAGCGTGNYTKALLNAGLGHVTVLDASSGMLKIAREKLVDEISAGRVTEVTEAIMPPLPYKDESFDAVMFNLVLQHLQENPDGVNFPAIEAVLTDTRRVLKKGGVLAISTSFPKDYLPLVWFTKLNEDIMERHSKCFPTTKLWMEILEKCGYRLLSKLDNNMPANQKMMDGLLDPLGPTRKEWRDANSYWASATQDEIADVENQVLEMHKNGTLNEFVKEHNKLGGIFFLTFIFATPV